MNCLIRARRRSPSPKFEIKRKNQFVRKENKRHRAHEREELLALEHSATVTNISTRTQRQPRPCALIRRHLPDRADWQGDLDDQLRRTSCQSDARALSARLIGEGRMHESIAPLLTRKARCYRTVEAFHRCSCLPARGCQQGRWCWHCLRSILRLRRSR